MEMRVIGSSQLEFIGLHPFVRVGDPGLVDRNAILSAAQLISKGIA